MKPTVSYKALLFATISGAWCFAAQAQTASPGADVEGLLAIAREGSPDVRMVRLEAEAARERIGPAGALPDPEPPEPGADSEGPPAQQLGD